MSDTSEFMAQETIRAHDDAYFGRTTCSLQWRSFLSSLAVELHLGSEGAEVRQFLQAVGRRFATRLPLPKVETLPELEAAMNKAWLEIDWGWVRLGADEAGIWVVHGAYPSVSLEGEMEIWPRGAASVLEGAYSHWFTEQGSPGRRTVRASESIRPLEFRHS